MRVEKVEGEQVAAGDLDAGVARRAEPAVGLVDDANDVGVAGGVLLGDRAAPVRRPVVDDHDLERSVGLREQAVEARGEVGLGVVRRHDHAQQGLRAPQQHGLTLAVPGIGPVDG